jgi:hypothetical protein
MSGRPLEVTQTDEFRVFDALRIARALPHTSLAEHSVLVAIIMRSDASGRAWPSYERIAQDAHLSRRAACRATARLAAAGHILIERRPVKGRRESDSNVYTVKLGMPGGASVVGTDGHHVVTDVHHLGTDGHHGSDSHSPQVVTDWHGGGDWVAPEVPIEVPIPRSGERAPPAPPSTGSRPETSSRVTKGTQTSATAKRATQVPPSSAPRPDVEAWASRWAIPVADSEFLRFLDHWRGKGEVRADWGATWRNWKRNEVKFATKSTKPGGVPMSLQQQPPATGKLWKVGLEPGEESISSAESLRRAAAARNPQPAPTPAPKPDPPARRQAPPPASPPVSLRPELTPAEIETRRRDQLRRTGEFQ